MENSGLKKIIEVYKENFSIIQNDFMRHQNECLIQLYKSFNGDLEAANIFLYFFKQTQKKIFRRRESEMGSDISLEKMCENIKELNKERIKVIKISKETGLAKETVRRKIKKLIKLNILTRDINLIYWEPNKDFLIIKDKINKFLKSILKLILTIKMYLSLFIDKNNLEKELLNNFSFYSYHYLDVQLKFLQIWKKKFKDLDVILILQLCAIEANSKYFKSKISYENHFFNKKNKLDITTNSISATLVSNITGMPRSTCIRKLEKLVKTKILVKNTNSKKYTYNTEVVNKNIKELNSRCLNIFGEFYYTLLRNLKVLK
jgi:Fic family protein